MKPAALVSVAGFLFAVALLIPCSDLRADTIKVYANREIRPIVLRLIEQAERTVDVQMYTFTEQDVIRALQAARSRGVTVRVLLDPNQSANLKNVEQLTNRRIEVKWAPRQSTGHHAPKASHRRWATGAPGVSELDA